MLGHCCSAASRNFAIASTYRLKLAVTHYGGPLVAGNVMSPQGEMRSLILQPGCHQTI